MWVTILQECVCVRMCVYVCVCVRTCVALLEWVLFFATKIKWGEYVYVDTYIYIYEHMSQATLLSNTHTYTHTHIHTHTHTHNTHTHTQWLLVSYVLVGIALVSGVVVILFERVKRRRGACVDLYIYICTQTHRRRYSLVRPLFLAVSSQISKTKCIYEKKKSLISLIVFLIVSPH